VERCPHLRPLYQSCQVGIFKAKSQILAFLKVVWHEKIMFGMYVIVWYFLMVLACKNIVWHFLSSVDCTVFGKTSFF